MELRRQVRESTDKRDRPVNRATIRFTSTKGFLGPGQASIYTFVMT